MTDDDGVTEGDHHDDHHDDDGKEEEEVVGGKKEKKADVGKKAPPPPPSGKRGLSDPGALVLLLAVLLMNSAVMLGMASSASSSETFVADSRNADMSLADAEDVAAAIAGVLGVRLAATVHSLCYSSSDGGGDSDGLWDVHTAGVILWVAVSPFIATRRQRAS